MSEVSTNWNDIWKLMMKAVREARCGEDAPARWAKMDAAQYWQRAHDIHGDRIGVMLDGLTLTRESRVLDVGSGPGVLTIPMARQAASVTAVDPSQQMIDFLLRKAAEEEIENIECVAMPWEEVDVARDLEGRFDVVVASLSLLMPDIEDAIRKMHRASLGSVHLLWFAGQPIWHEFANRIKDAVGKPHEPPMPGADVLFNVLYGMGIYANVTVADCTYVERYADMTEARDYYKDRLGIEGDGDNDVVDSIIAEWSSPAGEGLVLRFPSRYMSIWWQADKPV